MENTLEGKGRVPQPSYQAILEFLSTGVLPEDLLVANKIKRQSLRLGVILRRVANEQRLRLNLELVEEERAPVIDKMARYKSKARRRPSLSRCTARAARFATSLSAWAFFKSWSSSAISSAPAPALPPGGALELALHASLGSIETIRCHHLLGHARGRLGHQKAYMRPGRSRSGNRRRGEANFTPPVDLALLREGISS
ncbi:hypothetical protein LIER_17408 [Lithospermum erythrorhizon]|uniref:Uncharacterized protein n=1 Tax=Lithospermum erythrorhizon TaxID=34254 RepID=A0AAV3QCW2_LITER